MDSTYLNLTHKSQVLLLNGLRKQFQVQEDLPLLLIQLQIAVTLDWL